MNLTLTLTCWVTLGDIDCLLLETGQQMKVFSLFVWLRPLNEFVFTSILPLLDNEAVTKRPHTSPSRSSNILCNVCMSQPSARSPCICSQWPEPHQLCLAEPAWGRPSTGSGPTGRPNPCARLSHGGEEHLPSQPGKWLKGLSL